MSEKYTKKEIVSLLDEQGIAYHYQTHGAVHTMDDVDHAGVVREGVVLKNLFLKDGKGKKHFLVCVPESKHTDFKEIGEQIGAKKLGLASAERLEKYLGVEQGCVSPFGILNDLEKTVIVIMDQALEDDTVIGVHPNDTTASIWLKYGDMKKIIIQNGNMLHLLEFAEDKTE